MRLFLAMTTLLAAFGCTSVAPSRNAQGVSFREPMSELVQEDMDAILRGMDRAVRARAARAGL